MLKVSQLFGILSNWSLKIQNGMPLPFEYELGWTVFLAFGTPQKWILRGEKTEKWLQGQPSDLQHVKNVLPPSIIKEWTLHTDNRVKPKKRKVTVYKNMHFDCVLLKGFYYLTYYNILWYLTFFSLQISFKPEFNHILK